MLVNKKLAGKKVATEFGMVEFNDKGESKDLKADQEKKFENVPGFSVEQEKKEEKKEDKKEEKKEEKKPAKGKAKSDNKK